MSYLSYLGENVLSAFYLLLQSVILLCTALKLGPGISSQGLWRSRSPWKKRAAYHDDKA